jgi:hypothetical protein
MNDLCSAVENEINELIKTLNEHESSSKIFKNTQALMDKHGEERAKRIPHDLVKYLYESIGAADSSQLCIRSYMCSAAFAIQSKRYFKNGANTDALYCFKKAHFFFGRAVALPIYHPDKIEEKRVIDDVVKRIKEGGAVGGRNKDKKKKAREKNSGQTSFLPEANRWMEKQGRSSRGHCR